MGVKLYARGVAILILLLPMFLFQSVFAQHNTKIGLLLPLDVNGSTNELNKITQNINNHTFTKNKLPESVTTSLSFLQGFMQSITISDSTHIIEVQVFDTGYEDTLIQQILEKKGDDIRSSNLLIGPVTLSAAKLTAEFCKSNQIFNIQPFTPSRSVGKENPFLIKLNPSIDVICDNIFQSVLDSFRNTRVILYASSKGIEATTAIYLDSLIRSNKQAKAAGITSTLCLYGSEKKCSFSDLLSDSKKNIVISTSLNLSWVQGIIKPLAGRNIPLFGMPNWLQSEIIRLDYLNECQTRIPDFFWIDSSNTGIDSFTRQFIDENHSPPDRNAWLGKDIGDYCRFLIDSNGNIIPESLPPYKGMAYRFDLRPHLEGNKLQYWENSYCPILQINAYQLRKIH